MKFSIVLAAALALGSCASLAAGSGATATDSASPPVATAGRGACKADVQKFCAGVEHAKGKIRECLTQHTADLSDTCKQRMAAHAAKTPAPAN